MTILNKILVVLGFLTLSSNIGLQRFYHSDFDYHWSTIYTQDILPQGLTYAELKENIHSTRLPIRISAVNRATYIGDTSFVSDLILAYEKEPYVPLNIRDVGPGLKYLILRALGKIGGEKAYKYLKTIQYQIPDQDGSIREAGGDPEFVYEGLLNSLALFEPSDSAYIYFNIYNQNRYDPFLRKKAFQTYEKLILKDSRFRNLTDSLYYLIDASKSIKSDTAHEDTIQITSNGIARTAIRSLIVVYGAHSPSIIEKYKSSISESDPFFGEVSYILSLAMQKARNNQSKINEEINK